MYSQENRGVALARQLDGFDYAIVDTCSLMEDGFPLWMDAFDSARHYLKEPKTKIYVLSECIAELKKHSNDQDHFDRRVGAQRALKIIRHAKFWKKIELLDIKNDSEHAFADQSIFVKVSTDRLDKRILVITQDKKLASDIKGLNDLMSQHGQHVSVFKLTESGTMVPNLGETFSSKKESRGGERRGGERSSAKPAPSPKSDSSSKKPTRPLSPDEVVAKIQQMDGRLRGLLMNPTCPADKKIAALQAQLEAFRGLSAERKRLLKLQYSEEKLREALASLSSPKEGKAEEKPTVGSTPAPSPAPKAEKPASPKPIAASTPKAEKPSLPLSATKKLWYGSAPSLREALSQVASHYGLMFRDKAIAFVPQVHGPVDLTGEDAELIVAKLETLLSSSPKAEIDFKGIQISASQANANFKVYLNLHPEEKPAEPSPKAETAPAERPAAQAESLPAAPKAKKPAKPKAPKAETKAEPEAPKAEAKPKNGGKKAAPKPAAKPAEKPAQPATAKTEPAPRAPKAKKPSAPKPSPKAEPAEPSHATLIVAVPTDKSKKERIERQVRATSSSDTFGPDTSSAPKKRAKKPSAPKAEPKSAKAKQPKTEQPSQAPKAQPKAQPSSAKTAPKAQKANGPKTPKPEAAKASPKQAPKAKAEKPSDPLSLAKRGEEILRADLSNPKATKKRRLSLLAKQRALLAAVPAEQRSSLSFTEEEIARFEKENQ